MPRLIIDNRKIEVSPGTKVIEAAERVGIVIPRFCFHPALGSVGACRVCAVAFKEGPVKGIQMSCMTSAQDGMVVSTTDEEAVDFRRHVIEWLMLHHPHDCPVCDEGGHCLLQDLTVSGGQGLRRYKGPKRTHVDQNLGPLVQHEMNRCIQCYRCVRYYQEYAGYRDLGVMGIGSRIYFGRVESGSLQSPFAGNLIDICPTGVYTDKPSRFFGRRWEFERAPSLCLHCSLGCNLTVSGRYRQIVRHEARSNDRVNGYFICDRGRYGYGYANAAQRPRLTLVKGQSRDMEEAVNQAAARLAEIAEQFGPDSVAVAVSSRSNLETLALVGRACHDLKWTGPAVVQTERNAVNLNTVVKRLTPELAASMGDVADADTAVVVGADPINEAPMLALALRQIKRRSGEVTVIDPRPVQMSLDFTHWAVHPSEIAPTIEKLIRAIDEAHGSPEVSADETGLELDQWQTLARHLMGSKKLAIICGTDIATERDIAMVGDLADTLYRMNINTGLFFILTGPNEFSTGLLDGSIASMERVLHQIESGRIRALIMVEGDAWIRFPNRPRLTAALSQLELLIVMDYMVSPLIETADFFFPTRTIYEAGGYWVNQEGRPAWAQPVFSGGEPITITGQLDHPPRKLGPRIPGTQPQAAWWIMAKLVDGFNGHSTQPLDQYLQSALKDFYPAFPEWSQEGPLNRLLKPGAGAGRNRSAPRVGTEAPESFSDLLTLLLVERTFGTEPLSDQTVAEAELADPPSAEMHPLDIERLGFSSGEVITLSTAGGRFSLALFADDRMAPGVVVVPRHHRLEWQIVDDTRTTINRSQIKAAD